MAQSSFEIKKEICEVGKKIYNLGFVAANDGNISVKVGPNEFYCTPTGVSNDARDVWAAADAGNKRAKLAMDILVHYAKKIIGSYVAELNGMDVLIFTAGLGENDRMMRQLVCENMDYLGVKIDKDINMNGPRGENLVISTPDSKVKVVVIPTDEEFMIASDTYDLVK